MQYKYDEFQLEFIHCDHSLVVGEAFAGAGKTTSAIGYALHRPHMKMLYVCLNKANQEEASRRFPKNVTCRTSHGLAYAAIGRLYGDRLVGSWKARHVAEDMGFNLRMATVVHAVLNEFFGVVDDSVDPEIVMRACKRFDVGPGRAEEILLAANATWSRMCDLNGSVKITHDAYLKMWALSKPQLPYGAILLDEAQDTNPVTAHVMLSQKHARVVMIGDQHQSIYMFRGATNAMEQFASAGATVIKMPRTWRFGERTASLANALLQTYKGERTSIIGMGTDELYVDGAPFAYLARTNAQLFTIAAETRGKGVHWVGGSKNYRLDLVLDAYHLYAGKKSLIRDPMLSRYPSWQEYKSEFEQTQDAEAKILIEAVETYLEGIPQLIDDIKFNEVPIISQASRVLTSAHRSKGLEFGYVKIGEDFKVNELIAQSMRKHKKLTEDVKQEVNLLYVGISRASKRVFLNEDSKNIFRALSGPPPEAENQISLEQSATA
jgi:hypothetical protein